MNKQKGPLGEGFLSVGWFMAWQTTIYEIVGFQVETLTLELVRLADAEQATASLQVLLADPTIHFAPSLAALHAALSSHRQPTTPLNVAGMPEPLLTRARCILTTVEVVEEVLYKAQQEAHLNGQRFQRTTVLQVALGQLSPPVSKTSFYKYRQLVNQNRGNLAELAASLRRSSYNQTCMNHAQLHFVDTLILRFCNRRRPLRPQTLYRLAQSILQRTNTLWIDPNRCSGDSATGLVEELLDPTLPITALSSNPEKMALLVPIQLPSRSWLYTYLRWFEQQPEQGKQIVIARYGQEVWDKEHLAFDTFVTRAALPLEYVFADHYLLDVFIVDEATRQTLDRLWLTLLIDAYSRSILGMALLYEPPSIMSIQTALQHAVWPKTSHQALGIVGEWACYGIPQQLSLDNAWAHHSHSLEDLARQVSQQGQYNSIDLAFRPPYRGRYGALIERFFGNLAGQLRAYLPGAILSSQPRHIRSAVKEACLLYRDVNRFLHQAIVTYQHTVHSELQGLTPHEKWVEGLQMGLPLVPPQTPAMVRAFWRMSPQSRVLTNKGICAFGMEYWSPTLRQAARFGKHGERIHYLFRYDPADISGLALFHNGSWVGDVQAKELRQPDGSWLSLSLTERTIAQQLAHRAGDSPRDWLHYLHEVEQLAKVRQAERRQIQRSSRSPQRPAPDAQTIQTAVSALDTDNIYQDYTALLSGFLKKEE